MAYDWSPVEADSPPDFAPPLTCDPGHRKAPRHESFGEFCRRGTSHAAAPISWTYPRTCAPSDNPDNEMLGGSRLHQGTKQSLAFATHRLRYESAANRVVSAFHGLERRYSPDQPRVPAGNSDGGQWTDTGASGAGRRRHAQNMGKVTFSGSLVRQNYDSQVDRVLCMFYDRTQDYYFVVSFPSRDCPIGYINY